MNVLSFSSRSVRVAATKSTKKAGTQSNARMGGAGYRKYEVRGSGIAARSVEDSASDGDGAGQVTPVCCQDGSPSPACGRAICRAMPCGCPTLSVRLGWTAACPATAASTPWPCESRVQAHRADVRGGRSRVLLQGTRVGPASARGMVGSSRFRLSSRRSRPADFVQIGVDENDQNMAKNNKGSVESVFAASSDELSENRLAPYSEVFGLARFRETELIHGRWAMLAALGAIVAEATTGVSWWGLMAGQDKGARSMRARGMGPHQACARAELGVPRLWRWADTASPAPCGPLRLWNPMQGGCRQGGAGRRLVRWPVPALRHHPADLD